MPAISFGWTFCVTVWKIKLQEKEDVKEKVQCIAAKFVTPSLKLPSHKYKLLPIYYSKTAQTDLSPYSRSGVATSDDELVAPRN